MHLVTLEPDEEVIFPVRKHRFIFLWHVSSLLIVWLLPFLFAQPLMEFLNRLAPGAGGNLSLLFLIFWTLGIWVVFFFFWTDYYFDVWVITTKHIFDIEQKGMFNRDVSVFHLANIQDVTVEIRGVFATLLGFGDITIHTAGEKQDLTIPNAAQPLKIKQLISEAHSKILEDRRRQGVPVAGAAL